MSGVGSSMAEGLVTGVGSVILIVVLIAVVRWVMKLSRAAKSLPQNFAARKVANSEAEEGLYEFIRQEIESGEIRSGLWTKAEATANSIENAAIRAKYIQLRFEQLEAQGQLQIHELAEAEESAPENTFQRSETLEKPEIEQEEEEISDEEKRQSAEDLDEALGWAAGIFFFFLFLFIVVAAFSD